MQIIIAETLILSNTVTENASEMLKMIEKDFYLQIYHWLPALDFFCFIRQPWGMSQLGFLPLTSLSTSRPALQLSHLAAYKLLFPSLSSLLPWRPHIFLFKSVSPAASLFSPSPENHGVTARGPGGSAPAEADTHPRHLMTLGRLPAGSRRCDLPSRVAGLDQRWGRRVTLWRSSHCRGKEWKWHQRLDSGSLCGPHSPAAIDFLGMSHWI